MRRKARLNVLYWPAIASAVIILILIAGGPLASVLHPALKQTWAGGDLGTKLKRWLPDSMTGVRTVTLPWRDMASESESNGRSGSRPASTPRTLLIQTEGRGLVGDQTLGDAREELDWDDQPRGFHSPHALRMEAENDLTRLAGAKLLAPRLEDNEELAGIDRSGQMINRLASQSISSKSSSAESVGRDSNESLLDMTGSAGDQTRAYVSDELRSFTKAIGEQTKRGHGIGGGWPETPQLTRDLEMAARVAAQKGLTRFASARVGVMPLDFSIDDWQRELKVELKALTSLPSVTSPDAGEVLLRLQRLAEMGREAGELASDRELQIRLLRVTHGLERRLAVWSSVWRTTQGTVVRVSDFATSEDDTLVDNLQTLQMISDVQSDASQSDDAEGWNRFLMTDDLVAAHQSGDHVERRMVAQRVLSRLDWHRLSHAQQAWLDRPSIRNLSIQLHRWAATPVDYSGLLAQLERQESDAIDLGAIDVASAVQTLRFAESREANRIAQSLNTYYRNANMRVAITSELISRMIPEVDAQVKPVRDRILGADVRGTSVAHSDLSLRLIPSDRTWKFALENQGRINTGASSRQWPVAIRSDSFAAFRSSTPIEITPDGAVLGSTAVNVDAKTKLRGIRSDFDSVPLFGSLVREIARNRYDSMAPVTGQIQKAKIRGGVSGEVDQKVSEQLDIASETLARRLTGPLGSLQLSPLVVDMQTAESRLSARYRVAGDWQLAAFTPRPRAPQASLMSVQMHQSAINNLLETVLPSGEPKSIGEVAAQVKQLFGVQDSLMKDDDDDFAADALIQFASTRPITVEIEDDILWVTIRVMRLKHEGIDLRRFIVRAGFRPQVDGLSASLVRDGHLRISGPDMSMRDRLPVRAIFNKVFSTRRPLPLVQDQWTSHPGLDGLVVTQAELRDGWIAIAIGDANSIPVTVQVARNEEDELGSNGSF